MQLAPIGLSTYSRLDHLRKTVDALKANPLAQKSELYIFSDAPREGDEKPVLEVRKFLKSITGFKSITTLERATNSRTNNNRSGMNMLLEKYGRIIFLEEDVVTAPGFLTFMNEALDYYANRQEIISISGYCPPISLPDNYDQDSFLLKRFNSWGFATWSNKFDLSEICSLSQDYIRGVLDSKEKSRLFGLIGPDALDLIEKEANHEIDALDVKLMLYQFKHNLYTAYPSRSLTQNIGHDGTGEHCTRTSRFQHHRLWNKSEGFKFQSNRQLDPQIVKIHYDFRNYSSFRNRVSRLFKGR